MPARDTAPVDSYYAATQRGEVAAQTLRDDVDADVAVIGGGLTGASAALHLATRGMRVVQLEARHYGWGASGRSGGQIVNGYSADPRKLESLVGMELARELWAHSVRAVELTESLIKQFTIDCDYRRGYLHVAAKPRQFDDLQKWAENLARNYNYDALQIQGRAELRARLNSAAYCGGVFDSLSGHLHPLNYCLGVANAAAQSGAQLFERAWVEKVRAHADGYEVICDNARVRCRQVIYACNAYLDNLAPALRRRIMPVGTYIVATEPLSESRADALIPSRAAAVDSNFVLDYFRLSADHRMLFGGRVSYSRMQPRKLKTSLRQRMLRVFPQLDDVNIDYAWGGYVAITRNRAPHIGRQADGTWFAQGYSGHGMALSAYVGKLLADAALGNADELQCFNAIRHAAFPGGRWLRTPILVAAMAYYRLRDKL